MRTMLTVVLLTAFALPARADDKRPNAEDQARTVAPFLGPQTIVVAHVNLDRLDVDAIWKEMSRHLRGIPGLPFEHSMKDWVSDLKRLGGHQLYLLFDLGDFPNGYPVMIVPVTKDSDSKALIAFLSAAHTGPAAEQGSLPAFEVCEKVGSAIFCGSRRARERQQTAGLVADPELAKAFGAADGAPVQVLLLPSADVRRVVEEMFPVLPAELGGKSGTVITRGIKWAAAGLWQSPHMRFQLVIQSEDASAAGRLDSVVGAGLRSLEQNPEFKKLAGNPEQLIRSLSPAVEGDRLVVRADAQGLMSALLRPLASSTERTSATNRLKQIGLAMHNYHDVKKSFPPAALCSSDGKRLLSWRVLILPFVEQQKLYEQFHLDEPWDSEHNRKLIERMPNIYRTSTSLPPGKTTFLGIAGESGMFPGCRGVSIREVTDGTSNTIFVVDAADARAVVWTKPEDLTPDFQRPLDGLVGHFDEGFLALFVDASVHFVSKSVAPQTLKALFTRNGGEVVTLP